jgi:hypothetical protein
MLSMSGSDIFSAAIEVAHTQQAFEYLTKEHEFTNEEIDFFLKFLDPLDMVCDRMDAEGGNAAHAVETVFGARKWILEYGSFVQMSEVAPPTVAETPGKSVATEKPSMLDRLRKAREKVKNNPVPHKDTPNKAQEPEH